MAKKKAEAIDPDVSFLEDARTVIAYLRGTGTWQQALHSALHLALYALEQLTPAEVKSMKGAPPDEPLDREALAKKLEAACDQPRTVAEGNHPRAAVDWRSLLAMLLKLLPLILAAH